VQDGCYRGHSIDALFCSLARHAGVRTIGVILSGLLKDGTSGLKAIKEAGGIALVQSPWQAAYGDMPESAIAHDGPIDLVAGIDEIAAEVCRLVGSHTPVSALGG
jgi:chemotaxis response regulator CheB